MTMVALGGSITAGQGVTVERQDNYVEQAVQMGSGAPSTVCLYGLLIPFWLVLLCTLQLQVAHPPVG